MISSINSMTNSTPLLGMEVVSYQGDKSKE